MRAFVIALALALAVPAAASAQTTAPVLTATGGSVHGYRMFLIGGSNSAEVDLIRKTHGSTQSHVLSNVGTTPISYTAAADLSTAQIDSRWGPHGSVSFSFKATGAPKKILPADCTGKPAQSRTGVLTGTLTAKLDKRFFKTITRTTMTATLSEAGEFFCGANNGGGFGGPGLTALSIAPPTGGVGGSFVKLGTKETLENAVAFSGSPSDNWSLTHLITAKASASALSSSSLGKATVKGAGPFFAGKLTFKAAGAAAGNAATGHVSGSFEVKFDSIGTKRFSKKAVATLSKT
jgi:hypothetical protein